MGSETKTSVISKVFSEGGSSGLMQEIKKVLHKPDSSANLRNTFSVIMNKFFVKVDLQLAILGGNLAS